MIEFSRVTCPSCYETFEVACPALDELPVELDYDCEICCRPMILLFREEAGEIASEARSLDE